MLRILAALGSIALAASAQNPSLGDVIRGGAKPKPPAAAPKPVTSLPPQQRQESPAVQPSGKPGFRMSLPPGWRSGIAPSGMIAAQSPDGASLIFIAPVAAPAGADAVSWMKQAGAAKLAGMLPQATLAGVGRTRSGNGALSAVDYRGPGRANAMVVLHGGVGTLYVIAAPAARFAQERPALVRILASFSFDGEQQEGPGRAPAAQPSLSFVRFEDPYERAFTTETPAGWSTRGGMIRKGPVDVRAFLRMQSPDGVMVGVGDPELPPFVIPTQTMAMSGFGEGSNYSPGYGSSMRVARYLPGPVFAQQYAGNLVRGAGLEGCQVVDQRQRPEFSGTQQGLATQTVTAGEVALRCRRGGQEVAAWVLAATQATTMQGMGMWHVTALVTYIAPVDRVALAEQAIARVASTFRVSPQWFGAQQQTTAETSRIVSQTNEQISRTISDSYWSRQRTQDRTNRNFSDSIRGVVRLRDPDTGEELEGTAGKNYYWRVRGTNTIVGQDTPTPPPTIDVTELEQVR